MDAPAYEPLMRRALELARQGWGRTHPNPMVGALIVEDGRVVAEGFHAKAGQPHAEAMALINLGRRPKPGALMVVTLEPCSTQGRTGACTEKIIKAGISKLVVGATDPHPAHAGKGFSILRVAGVDVVAGVLERECEDLNSVFNHWIQRQTPLLAGKIAVSADGFCARKTGARDVTGALAHADVHKWRACFPAIAVGSGTALTDNPALTVRLNQVPEYSPRARFVFDRKLRVFQNPSLCLLSDGFREHTVIVTDTAAPKDAEQRCAALGVQCWRLDKNHFFEDFRAHCAAQEITGVYCEGGSALLKALLEQKQLDYFFRYTSPEPFGENGAAKLNLNTLHFKNEITEKFGSDTLQRGKIFY